jgi:hypothetical protein
MGLQDNLVEKEPNEVYKREEDLKGRIENSKKMDKQQKTVG